MVFELVMIFVAIVTAVNQTRSRKFSMKVDGANTKKARQKHEKELEKQFSGTPEEGENR
jgi:hypothetical protein